MAYRLNWWYKDEKGGPWEHLLGLAFETAEEAESYGVDFSRRREDLDRFRVKKTRAYITHKWDSELGDIVSYEPGHS